VLYEAEIATPYPSTYRQHQYLHRLFATLDDPTAKRDWVWCESDGILYVRRGRPTNEVPWRPVQIPPAGSMINFQLTARCRRELTFEDVWGNRCNTRPSMRDPSECLAWVQRNADWYMGLQIEEAEVEEISRWIGKKTETRRHGFYLLGSHFEGIAKIIDPARFEFGLARGIGDSKAFGFGFMFFWQRGQHNGA
jgi:hypothetical protein